MLIEKQGNVVWDVDTEGIGKKKEATQRQGRRDIRSLAGDADSGQAICRSDIITPLNNPTEK